MFEHNIKPKSCKVYHLGLKLNVVVCTPSDVILCDLLFLLVFQIWGSIFTPSLEIVMSRKVHVFIFLILHRHDLIVHNDSWFFLYYMVNRSVADILYSFHSEQISCVYVMPNVL